MQTGLSKSTLSLVLVATAILIWATPAAALRQTGLEESREERDKLKTALTAKAGNFPKGRLLPPTAGALPPPALPTGLEEDLDYGRAWEQIQGMVKVNGVHAIGFWVSEPVFLLDQSLAHLYKPYAGQAPDPVSFWQFGVDPLYWELSTTLSSRLQMAIEESPIRKVRFSFHRGSGGGQPALYILPAGLARRAISASERLKRGDRLVAKEDDLIMAAVLEVPAVTTNRPVVIKAWSPMSLPPVMEMDMPYLAQHYDVIPARVAPVATAGLEEQEVDFAAWLARSDAEPANRRRLVTIGNHQVEAVRLPSGKIAVGEAVTDALAQGTEGFTLAFGKGETLTILPGFTGLAVSVAGPDTDRHEVLRYTLVGAPNRLLLIGKAPSLDGYPDVEEGRSATVSYLTVGQARDVSYLHLAILVGPAEQKKFWVRDLSKDGTYVPFYALAALRKQLEQEVPPVPAPQPPQPRTPATAGLEESNLRQAIAAGNIFSFDFFENISEALIDAAIKAGATEFTMNPYSTGNYIQHLMTLTTPEGFARARGLQLLQPGREYWVPFRQELDVIAKDQPRVHKAIKAALEPSPDVTPETEQALAQEVITSELAESREIRRTVENLARGTANGEQAYWAISKYLAEKIAKKLLPIYQQSNGRTGYVSIEVDPRIERPEFARARAGAQVQELEGWMAQRMQAEAEDLSRVAENVLVKVPNTAAGLATVRQVNAHFNVTLTFADEDAREAITAYEARKDPKHILRISPFVSRNAVYFEEFWAELLSVPGPKGGRLLDGHAATIGNMFDVHQAMGPYADRALWSSLGMKIGGDPGELYAKQVIGTGILNAPPETARDFNRAQFEVKKRFWLSAKAGEGLTSILSDYFSDVHTGKIPSAVQKFPQLASPNPTLSPWEQASQAALRWRDLINRPVTAERLQQFEARLNELEQKKGVKRPFTREALEIARAQVAAGQAFTEKDLMRLVLKKEGEEKFIAPFQAAIDLLERTLEEIRTIEQARPLHDAGLRLVEGWLALPVEQQPALQVDDQTFTFYERTAGPQDVRRNVTLEQVREFLRARPAAVVQLFRRQPGPDLLYLLELRTPSNQTSVTAQTAALQEELARATRPTPAGVPPVTAGLEEGATEAAPELANQRLRQLDAERRGETSLAGTVELDLRRAEAEVGRRTSELPEGIAAVGAAEPSAKGVKLDQISFLTFDLAAGLALTRALSAETSVVAATPQDYDRGLRLGIPARHFVGLVGETAGEGQYLSVNPGIATFLRADPSADGWRGAVLSLAATEAEQAERILIVVFDARSLEENLRGYIPDNVIRYLLQVQAEADDSLRQMP